MKLQKQNFGELERENGTRRSVVRESGGRTALGGCCSSVRGRGALFFFNEGGAINIL